MTGLIESAHFLGKTRTVLYNLAEVAGRTNKPEKEHLVEKIKQVEQLIAGLLPQLQKFNQIPDLPKKSKDAVAILSELRKSNPLCFRAIKLSAPMVGRPDIEIVEISDEDLIKLNHP